MQNALKERILAELESKSNKNYFTKEVIELLKQDLDSFDLDIKIPYQHCDIHGMSKNNVRLLGGYVANQLDKEMTNLLKDNSKAYHALGIMQEDDMKDYIEQAFYSFYKLDPDEIKFAISKADYNAENVHVHSKNYADTLLMERLSHIRVYYIDAENKDNPQNPHSTTAVVLGNSIYFPSDQDGSYPACVQDIPQWEWVNYTDEKDRVYFGTNFVYTRNTDILYKRMCYLNHNSQITEQSVDHNLFIDGIEYIVNSNNIGYSRVTFYNVADGKVYTASYCEIFDIEPCQIVNGYYGDDIVWDKFQSYRIPQGIEL